MLKDPQAEFDRKYITGAEVRKRLGVKACTITLAHQRGTLPKPISVGGAMHIWERERIEPFLRSWEALREMT